MPDLEVWQLLVNIWHETGISHNKLSGGNARVKVIVQMVIEKRRFGKSCKIAM